MSLLNSLRLFATAAGLLVTIAAFAGEPQNITSGEIALLPEYCRDAQGFETRGFPERPTPGQARWIPAMGRGFWAIHHYCWALVGVQRAKKVGISEQERRYLYESAIADGGYVLNNVGADFVLLPEVHLRMAQFYTALGDIGRAFDHLMASRKAKPDYWPAYLEMAQVNNTFGRKQAAIDALQEGLQQVPDQPQLLATLRELTADPARPAGPRKPADKP